MSTFSAPEMWTSFLKNIPDHEWSMSKIVSALMGNRQYADKMLIYAENHNQMIRMITFTIGGRAYLNFMGNEFGHPKVISYIRGPLLFVFNFHPTEAYERYSVGVEEAGEYQIILNTDEKKYGGQGLVDAQQHIQRTISRKADGLQNCLELPLPSRTAQVESHIHAA
ncbi:Branching enzyme 1 [Populus alba x Populus x berolinensis]|nr:Branching enzyme 1 [Populus alba x Populus x berolinensis]